MLSPGDDRSTPGVVARPVLRLGHAVDCGDCGWKTVVSGDLALAACQKCGRSLAGATIDAKAAKGGGCCGGGVPGYDGRGLPRGEPSRAVGACCRGM